MNLRERAEALVEEMLAVKDPVKANALHEQFKRDTGCMLCLVDDGVRVVRPE